jgi:hypothetical protein
MSLANSQRNARLGEDHVVQRGLIHFDQLHQSCVGPTRRTWCCWRSLFLRRRACFCSRWGI